MRKDQIFRYLAIFSLCMIFTINLFAQGKSISGTVTDDKKEPLPGVTIVVKGTTAGTVTDVDRTFQLTVPPNAKTLMFSYIEWQSSYSCYHKEKDC